MKAPRSRKTTTTVDPSSGGAFSLHKNNPTADSSQHHVVFTLEIHRRFSSILSFPVSIVESLLLDPAFLHATLRFVDSLSFLFDFQQKLVHQYSLGLSYHPNCIHPSPQGSCLIQANGIVGIDDSTRSMVHLQKHPFAYSCRTERMKLSLTVIGIL